VEKAVTRKMRASTRVTYSEGADGEEKGDQGREDEIETCGYECND